MNTVLNPKEQKASPSPISTPPRGDSRQDSRLLHEVVQLLAQELGRLIAKQIVAEEEKRRENRL